MKLRNLTKITAVATTSMIAANATGPIGAVQATGRFLLNGVPTTNQATLMEGAVLENSRAASEILLKGGTRMVLSHEAKAEVHQNAATLLRGTAQIAGAKDYALNASGFKIVSETKSNTLLVALGKSVVRVGALNGEGKVLDAKGALIARVTPGMTLDLQAGAANPQSMKISGKLVQQDGRFYVDDQVSHVRVEVTGKDLAAYLGQTVNLTGTVIETAPTPSVAYKVKVDSIDKPQPGAISRTAEGAGATIGASGAGAGMSTTTAVIGGVAVAGATGGTIAAVKMRSEPTKNLSH